MNEEKAMKEIMDLFNKSVDFTIESAKLSSIHDMSNIKYEFNIKIQEIWNNINITNTNLGEKVLVVGYLDSDMIKYEGLTSMIYNEFLIIDMPMLLESGYIFTLDSRFLIGLIIPVVYSHNFQIGIALQGAVPRHSLIRASSLSFPVVKIQSFAQGSGVKLSKNYLITNAHVVKSKSTVKINSKIKGKVKRKGEVLDLALVSSNLLYPYAVLAKNFIEGEKIYAVGFALVESEEPLVTQGYLTKIVYYRGFPVLGMISAPTYSGQSGGGVFNADNELIGLITANIENLNDKVYSDIGYCILNTAFNSVTTQAEPVFSYLWDEFSKNFADLFSFQTTKTLPFPNL